MTCLRKIMNSSSPISTLNLQLHVEQFSLGKNLKTSWMSSLHIRQMRKNPYQSGKERLTHNLTIKPTPSTATHSWEETQSQELDLNSMLALPELRTASERGAFKTFLALKSSEAQVPKTQKAIVNWEMAFKGLTSSDSLPQGPVQKQPIEAPRVYVKGVDMIILKCWPEGQASNLTHI